jgi:hypothetical protein
MLKIFDVHRHYPHTRYAGTAHEATPVPVSQAKLPYHYAALSLIFKSKKMPFSRTTFLSKDE